MKDKKTKENIKKLLKNKKKIKLDIGCGKRKKEGFVGIDIMSHEDIYPGKCIQCDVTEGLPLPDNSVTEIYSNRFFEHIPFHYNTPIKKRPYDPLIHIFEEIHRVSVNKAKIRIIVPTNPEEYPFHTRRYGIYSMEEFTDKGKDTFSVSKKKFKLISSKFVFKKGLNPFNYLGRLMNVPFLRDKITLSCLRYLFVPFEIEFILEVEK